MLLMGPVEAEEQEKVVAVCRWVPAYWYESVLVQDCKQLILYIKRKKKTTTTGGFLPHWVSTLNLGVHVCCLCVMVYSVITAQGYCLMFNEVLMH